MLRLPEWVFKWLRGNDSWAGSPAAFEDEQASLGVEAAFTAHLQHRPPDGESGGGHMDSNDSSGD